MILIYILLVVLTSTAAYPQRRNFNPRKTKIINEYNNKPTHYAKPLNENKYRPSRQYIPIHRIHKHKEPEINSRSDYFADEDDFIKTYAVNKTTRSSLKKYVTTDEIRPTRYQYSTTKNSLKRANRKTSPTTSNYPEEYDEPMKSSPERIRYSVRESETMNNENQNKESFVNYQVSSTNEKQKKEPLVNIYQVPSTTEKQNKESFVNYQVPSTNEKQKKEPLVNIYQVPSTTEKQNIEPFVNMYQVSSTIENPNKEQFVTIHQISSTTPRPQAENEYSSFSVDQYFNNPFLSSILKKSPTTAFLPPIEVTPSSVQYLPPIQSTEMFYPSPEIVNPELEPIYIPPNVEQQKIDYENSIPANEDLIYNHDINMSQMTELITAPPEIIQPNIQHIQPYNNDPPQENIFLPPKFDFEIKNYPNFNDNNYKNNFNADDLFQQEAMREMSFESVKLSNNPSSTPRPIRNFSPSPMIDIIPPTIPEPYTLPPITNEVIQIEENKPETLETDYLSQRRNDGFPFIEQRVYPNRPIKQFNVDHYLLTQSPSPLQTNSIDRTSREQNWITNDQLNSEQNHHLQLEEAIKQIEKEYTASLQTTPYGLKIGQQQYPFAAERSNGQHITSFENSITADKSQESTTVNYDTFNIKNVKHPQEFSGPVSNIRHSQEYNNMKQMQENMNQHKSVQNQEYSTSSDVKIPQEFTNLPSTKPTQEDVNTSVVNYPKEFTKALQTYVEKQKVKAKQENSVEKKKELRQPKDYPKDFMQRSEQGGFYGNNDLFSPYGDQFIDTQNDAFSQPLNYTYNKGPTTESIPVLRQTKEMAIDGSFHYETLIGDQTHVIQEGHIENPGTDDEEQVIHGSYSFLGDDGKTYTVNYVADGNGFRASGDHLPTPPPIPEIIQRSIEKNLAEAEKNPDVYDPNYKLNPTFSDYNNGIRERSSNVKPIYANNLKGLNTDLRPPVLRMINKLSNQQHQPNFHQVIQPRRDNNHLTDMYSMQRMHSDENNSNHSGGNNAVNQRRSDKGMIGEVFIDDNNKHIDNANTVVKTNPINEGNINLPIVNNPTNNITEKFNWSATELNYDSNQNNFVNSAEYFDSVNNNNYDKIDNSNRKITAGVTTNAQINVANDVYPNQNSKIHDITYNSLRVNSNSNQNMQTIYNNNGQLVTHNYDTNYQSYPTVNQNRNLHIKV